MKIRNYTNRMIVFETIFLFMWWWWLGGEKGYAEINKKA